MIDLHTHTLLSDGALLASELVRRAEKRGYEAIAITDHCDWSNIDFVVPHIVKACESLNRYWKIKVIPGVEITHVPVQEISPLVKFAREHGAKIVVVHGETPSEPVIKGTNRAAIESGADILAHPGNISKEDAKLAAEKGVYLELTTRASHCQANRHVADTARETGARLVLNTDAHSPDDFLTKEKIDKVFDDAGLSEEEGARVLGNSKELVTSLLFS